LLPMPPIDGIFHGGVTVIIPVLGLAALLLLLVLVL
jgi:hypothetical protein